MTNGQRWKPWQERLADGGEVNAVTGCINWTRSKNNRGYGLIYLEGKLHLAHRAAWLAQHGTWPNPALVVDHICNNKACVNIDHLRELTNAENIKRAHPRGDAATEHRREVNRRAKARYRAKQKALGGESNSVVQSR